MEAKPAQPQDIRRKDSWLGVLGGMGPDATAYFYRRFNHHWRLVSGTFHQYDYPRLLIDSLPVPDVVMGAYDRETDKLIASLMTDSLRMFESQGVQFTVIPCNTAHRQIETLRAATRCEILDMVEMVADRVAGDSHERVGLLSTRATIQSRLYEELFRERGGVVLLPQDETIDTVGQLILQIIGGGDVSNARQILDQAIAELAQEQGATAVVIGCTDLSIVLDELLDDPLIYDSTEVCAENTARKLWLLSQASTDRHRQA